jgi:hypothetical protein
VCTEAAAAAVVVRRRSRSIDREDNRRDTTGGERERERERERESREGGTKVVQLASKMSAVKPSVRSHGIMLPDAAAKHMNGAMIMNGFEDPNQELIAFETENFNPHDFVDAKFQSMTEKVCMHVPPYILVWVH